MMTLGKKLKRRIDTKCMLFCQKIEILTQFIARAKVDENMLTTLTADQKKNKEDPLTNMGMTKPGSRLQTEFGAINQEYHIKDPMDVSEGSGLWLKDATGVDKLVGQFISNPENSNKLKWGDLNTDLIQAKLAENEILRHPALGQAIRRVQTAIHLLPEKLAALGAGGEGAVVQIAAEVTQGITDATPFIGAEIRCQGHRLKTFDTQHG